MSDELTYTPEQIVLALAAMEGPRTLANGLWRDAFERDAPAIVKQQAGRIKELEVTMREIEHGARLASDPGRAHSCQISFDELLSNFGSLAESARCALAPGADHAALAALREDEDE